MKHHQTYISFVQIWHNGKNTWCAGKDASRQFEGLAEQDSLTLLRLMVTGRVERPLHVQKEVSGQVATEKPVKDKQGNPLTTTKGQQNNWVGDFSEV